MSAVAITHRARLDDSELSAVLELARGAEVQDGAPPFSEAVLLGMRYGTTGPTVTLLARRADRLVGAAHLDLDTDGDGPTAEFTVRPDYRRHGVGGALLTALEIASPDGRLRVWAHGRHPDAVALATARDYTTERMLWRLARPLADPLPERPLPDGIRLRAFEVGRDEPAWVRLNARAFAHHPDQGRLTVTDLRQREDEPWFDPAGFLLAERAADGALVGFHWTKVHSGPEPVGEVYVLGVDPDAQSGGLGAALTVAGLQYLRDKRLRNVILYVDDDNAAAMRLYQRLGFTEDTVDVRFRRRRSR